MTDIHAMYTDWRTVGVTPLPPGWVNVYRRPDEGLHAEPAPALLRQEAATETCCTYRVRESDGEPVAASFSYRDRERQTRLVFAPVIRGGESEPAAVTIPRGRHQ